MPLRDTERERVKHQIVDDLCSYLDRHPEAADTLEGIARWWLPQHAGLSHDDVLRALETLVAQGRVGARAQPDGRRLYFLGRTAESIRRAEDASHVVRTKGA